MAVRALRGAITANSNNRDDILSSARILLNKMIRSNNIEKDDIISIIFTVTSDLDAAFPAAAARELGFNDIALIDTNEMDVPGALAMCIRAMLHFNTDKNNSDLKHSFMRKAWKLRPDLLNISIAIDGPAGAGKSTIAKTISKKLGMIYLDTGAMYRAIALKALNTGADTKDSFSLSAIVQNTDISVDFIGGGQRIFLDKSDVTDQIRSPEVSRAASDVSAITEVRVRLVELQREIAANKSIIMDGRDIGTHVLPDADFKFFLTASLDARARRRFNEESDRGIAISFEDVVKDMQYRDFNDSTRKHSPLIKAEDAVEIDTTYMTIDEVSDLVIKMIGM